MTKSWQEQYEVLGRRMAPVIFAVVALGLIFVDLESRTGGGLATLCGILLLLCSIGMWTRKKFGWYAGLFAFPIGAAAWLVTAFSDYSLVDKPGKILNICVSIILICQAGFWPIIWKRYKKKWFSIEEKGEESIS